MSGKPDFIFPKYNAVIFTHGCFWHGHECLLFKWPSLRPDFWKIKINRNKDKDKESLEKLLDEGWRVMIIWECALKGTGKVSLEKITLGAIKFLTGTRKYIETKGEK